jgi:iron(II)-dependent oxidoreductase
VTTQASATLTHTAKQLVDQLIDTRTRELELLSDLTDEQMLGTKMRIIEPPLWEMGHVGWFQEYWLLRNLDNGDPISREADSLYDSFNIPNVERWDLAFLTRQETLDYITDVLNRCIQRLDGKEPTSKEVYFYRLVINHEDMHGETLHHIRQTLGYSCPPYPSAQLNRDLPPIDLDFEPHDVEVPGGTFKLGASPDTPFVLDNEKWAHPIHVAPFRISATPVTQMEYQAFVDAGGYLQREFWSDEGWAWRQENGVEYPVFWQKDTAGNWYRRHFDTLVPLEPYLPMVHVNWYEANAFCAWAGRRLPTEAEWEMAASAEPAADGRGIVPRKRLFPWGDDPPSPERANLDSIALNCIDVRALAAGDSVFGCRQMIGNVWEWTADTFMAYPSFEIDPYSTYSAPSFGRQKVLRGGCWATRSRVIRNTWRNFYTPDRNNIFAGFRTCAV